eukprot:s971_g17.t1
MALFKEIFSDFMLVKGVRISLRPFRKSGPEPQLAKASAYLRLHLCGHVKEWAIQPLEDIREMSISQINENFDVDDWLVTVFGAEQGGQPAPSTPSHRPRAIPPHPALPARRDDAAELLPEVRDRPGHPEEEADTAEPGYEEEVFESHDRAPLAPIRPSYNLKKVFDKLPKLLEAGQRTQGLRLLVGMHERLWHTPVMDFQNLLKKASMPQDVIDLAAEAVKGCAVCRKFVRLPNRPQLRAGGSSTFGEILQMDLFHWEGFYNPESPGVTSVIGALQTDLTVFERAMRIRQSALAQTAQAIIEDRTARANRTRPHQLKVEELTAGTSEVEFFRDQVWRGPALLLRLDQTEGVAVIQYQGKPYLVSLRHIREHRGIFHFEIQSENVEQALFSLMKYTESISDYRILYFGWLKRRKDGKWYKLPKETPEVRKILEWAELVSKSMTKLTLHGIMIGKALKSIKPPHSTTGTMIMWLAGGRKYSVQHHTNSNNLKLKKISNLAQEDTCMIYFYYCKTASMEPSSSETTETKKEKTSSITTSPIIDMDLDPPDRKRETPETRTVVIDPEKKQQKVALVDQGTNNINEDDLTPEMWPEVDKADLAEIRQFVEESAFRKIHKSQFTSDMVIVDAIWVRKKKRYQDGSIRIKSRLCARGFLDSQKSMLTTRSTTATRLSQRLLVSHAAQDEERDVESLDVGGAFLQGFSFKEIQQVLEKQGHQAPSRTVIILPPLNVFKHLANISDDFKIPEASIFEYGLLCNKPIYGLNDAPLAWQFCLRDFIRQLGGHASRMEENTFMWKENGLLTAMAATHVDDIAWTATPGWLGNIHDHFVKRFNKITRQKLPFVHCGERLPGAYRVSQTDFSKKLEKVKIPEKGDNEKLTLAETSSLRSILGALLWVTATRLDVVADVSILQSRVTVAEVRDLKYANQVVDKVKEFQDVGLHYRFRKAKNLRLVCIHDASSASQGRHYAQEGLLICLTEDKFYDENLNYETIFNDGDGPDGVDCHGGVMHVLHASGTKAKRVSYSTSHAETLSMINGVESSTLIMVRLSERLHPEPAPSLLQLTKIQEEGNKLLPVDYYGDCRDVFELVTGEKTLPQDKSQRLYDYSEHDLLKGDAQIMKEIKEKPDIASTSFATVLAGFAIRDKMTALCLLAMTSTMPAAAAMDSNYNDLTKKATEDEYTPGMYYFFMLLFFAALLALIMEKTALCAGLCHDAAASAHECAIDGVGR